MQRFFSFCTAGDAIGMATVTRAAVKRGICGEETLAPARHSAPLWSADRDGTIELDDTYTFVSANVDNAPCESPRMTTPPAH